MTDNRTISRRTLVKTGIGALAAPAVLGVLPAQAQSQVIKIGHVSPKTGPLAGFGEADGYILEQVRGILAKGLVSGGKTYKVEIISKDSQSNASRASEVASELILGDKINLIVASATPDTTNPVADQAEVNAAVGRGTQYLIPAFVFIFGIGFPAALPLYWLVSSLAAYAQQARILNEDVQAADASVKVITSKSETKEPNKPKPAAGTKRPSKKAKRRRR